MFCKTTFVICNNESDKKGFQPRGVSAEIQHRKRKRERSREREKERQRHTDRQTDRQTDRDERTCWLPKVLSSP